MPENFREFKQGNSAENQNQKNTGNKSYGKVSAIVVGIFVVGDITIRICLFHWRAGARGGDHFWKCWKRRHIRTPF